MIAEVNINGYSFNDINELFKFIKKYFKEAKLSNEIIFLLNTEIFMNKNKKIFASALGSTLNIENNIICIKKYLGITINKTDFTMFLRKNNINYRSDTKNETIKIFDFVYYEKTGNITINKYPFIYNYNYYQLYKLIKTIKENEFQ